MKKIIVVLLLLVISSSIVYGCDVCGCKLGGLYYGILPQYNSHFVGVRYSHASFNASITYDSEYLEDEYSHDTYQRVDLYGRYVFHPKFQMYAIVPYLRNQMDGSHQDVTESGVGDPMVLLYYNPFNTGDEVTNDWKHSLLLGAGVKLPLGDFESEDNGELINRNFQLGSGSLDYLISMNYTLRFNNLGLNIESSYKYNTANKYEYKFGNQLNSSVYLFYYFQTPQISFLPYTGIYFESAEKHLDGKVEQPNTGGSATFCSLGTQVLRNNFTLAFQYQAPISQNYNSDEISEIKTGNRFMINLLYNFSMKDKSKLLTE